MSARRDGALGSNRLESPADIERLVRVARKIGGVGAVENLLHVPGTPAPAPRSKLERDRATG